MRAHRSVQRLRWSAGSDVYKGQEFQVEKNEPKLQPKVARPNALAVIRSVSNGALNAIAAANRPTMLKSIRSTNRLFSGSTQLMIRCRAKTELVSHLSLRCGLFNFTINSKIMPTVKKEIWGKISGCTLKTRFYLWWGCSGSSCLHASDCCKWSANII